MVMKYNKNAIMIIKCTIPVGYTKSIREKTRSKNILFSPEFLRESKALYDNGWAKFLVGWENGIRTRKLIELGWKRCFCVEAVV